MTGEEHLAYCAKLSDEQLVFELKALTANERLGLIKILARLSELETRELEKRLGYSSLFLFCRRELGYCEGTAYYRLRAAEACRRFPELIELLEAGEIHVKAVAVLEEHLTFENHKTLIARARRCTQRELESLIAELKPVEKPPERTRVIAVPPLAPPTVSWTRPAESSTQGILPIPAPSSDIPVDSKPASPTPPAVQPSEPGAALEIRVEHRFTVAPATEEKIEKARRLLRHRFPYGDLESIFDEALEALLDRIDPDRRAERARPDRPPRDEETRRIPEWVKRRVRERDGEGCAFVSETGVRCGELDFLQFDHVRPWSEGGRSDDPNNVRQLCAAHNQWRERDRRRQALEAGGG